MSETDSFINEVSEEVRRDKLYGHMRRYGWIAVVAVLALVGGAAFLEWRKAQDAAAAQALGDQVLDALELETAEARAAALGEVSADGAQVAVVALLQAAELDQAGDTAGAVSVLDDLAANPDVPVEYSELAMVKSLILSDGIADPATRRAGLEALAVPGEPYRLIAQEQLALLDVSEGDTTAALQTLRTITEDAEVSQLMRDRALRLIEALGGDDDGAGSDSE